MSEPDSLPRSVTGCAWCWQDKAALRLICETFDESNNVPSATLVYVALTRIASDEQSETFATTVAHIASRVGLSPRTVGALLPAFEELKLIEIQRKQRPGSKLKAPSVYTLLSMRNDCLSIRNGHFEGSLPRSEESSEKSQKNGDEKLRLRHSCNHKPRERSRKSSSSNSDWIKEAEKDPFWPEYLRFCKSRNGSPTRKGWETWRAKQVVVKPPAPKKPKKVEPHIPKTSDEERARIAHLNARVMAEYKAKFNAG